MDTLFFGNLDSTTKHVAVVMAGGHGTRFWPLSRRARPKQFLSLAGEDQSLIALTVNRLAGLIAPDSVLVVTSAAQQPLVAEHVPEASVLAEPVPRNTAPCLGYAAVRVLAEVGDVPMLCMPADHLIRNEDAVRATYAKALDWAGSQDVLVTIGIVPSAPETGFGYIRRGEPCKRLPPSGVTAFNVAEFVEKPNRETAQSYLDSGEYYWNSGTFAWRPSVLLDAIREHLPELSEGLSRIHASIGSPEEIAVTTETFSTFSKISVDYGIMERADNVVMVPGEGFDWSDVGSWSAWAGVLREKNSSDAKESGIDACGNVLVGGGSNVVVKSKNCSVYGSERSIALVGVEDLIVVETDDAVLVCHRDYTQDVKEVVERLEAADKKDLL